MNRGFGPTGIVSVTSLVLASTRVTTLCSLLDTQTAPSPYTAAGDPGAIGISATILFVFGSMRLSTPFLSDGSHTAFELAVMPPSLSAGPTGIVATTVLVLMSTRETVLSTQFGTQMLPNPA